ncbi:MAG: glycoside hydrolase family 127 protein [Chitinispirillaceae bacterium]|nr:glycoside hydrolase family 127 protein [Chitinispirillaceae bacterium]
MNRTCSYLLWLNKDRLLYTWRINYGLPTGSVTPLGGWEGVGVGLRGHFMGHFLTALAQAWVLTGDNRYRAKADSIVTILAGMQAADASRGFSPGYLGAFLEAKVDSLTAGTNLCPWAPLYCIHKVFAGMIDCYNLLGNTTALTVATGMGNWYYNKLNPYTQTQREAFWNNMCWNAGEYGGSNEACANLYSITKTPNHLAAAKFFDHARLFTPCLNNQDRLAGLHANTQIPKIIGSMRIFENTGETKYYTIAKNFWNQVVTAHTYANGGNALAEWFQPPNIIATQLTDKTCETCNVYNMLKLSRLLFFHDPEPRYMDYYERALYNQILASQNPNSVHGNVTYFQPMAPGFLKTYGTDDGTFYCCDGSGLENHTKYVESIYFHQNDTLYVNLFIPSQLNWTAKGIIVRMDTRYPNSDTVRLTVTGSGYMPIKLRVPYWLRRTMHVRINGALQPAINTSGTYVKYNTTWNGTGTVEMVMPQTLRCERAPDDTTLGGAFYGAQLLSGKYGTNAITACPTLSFNTITKTQDTLLNFTATANPVNTGLIAYYRMHGERYSVYWKLINVPRDTFSVATLPGTVGASPLSPGMPEVRLINSQIRIKFKGGFSENRQVKIQLFALNGKRVAQLRRTLSSGEQYLLVSLHDSRMLEKVYVSKITVGRHSYVARLLCGN